MGYRVDYTPVKKVRNAEKRRVRLLSMIGVCLLLFLLLVSNFWPRGAEILQRLIFPGDAAVTVAALEDMVAELRSGEELAGALETFCRNMMQHAGFAFR